MKIRWMPVAANDLQRISDYLHANAPWAEERIVLEIYGGIRSLRDMPHKGRPTKKPQRKQLILPDIRYIVDYRIQGEMVEIFRIRHTSQKPLKQ